MKKNIITAITALSLVLIPVNSFAEENNNTLEETKTCSVTFLDFDGNVMQTMEVNAGEKIDYSLVDTSSLHSHLDIYTEQAFNMWSSTPESVSEDTTIQALYIKGTIFTEGTPTKTEYYSKGADINLDGFSVFIKREIQTPVIDENGNYYIDIQTDDITESCKPEKPLVELFAEEKTATVNIIPISEDKPIFSYEVTLFDSLGDADGSGIVNAVDASIISGIYANLSTGGEFNLDENQVKICDVNKDGYIDAIDASCISIFYSKESTQGNTVWENIVPELK